MSEQGGRDSQDMGRKQVNEGHSPPGDCRVKVFQDMKESDE